MLSPMMRVPPSRLGRLGGQALLAVLIWCTAAADARAQDPPPPLPPLVLDLHGVFTRLPDDDLELAASRGLSVTELPGSAWGADVGLHFYPFRFRGMTLGIGGQFAFLRGHQSPGDSEPLVRPVTERLVTGGAQLSFNFGTGNGWSYLSGGIGRSAWQIIPDGAEPASADEERLKTINYGGGARWFMKQRLAFSFDVRFHAINPGTPTAAFFGSPRTTLMVIGAGASLKIR
jgi:hypothetical protein